MSMPVEDARAQLYQKLSREEKDFSSISESIQAVDPVEMLTLASVIGDVMNDNTARTQLRGFVMGVQGMLFSGDWDKPTDDYEFQIELLNMQVTRNVGDWVVRENTSREKLSLLDEAVMCVFLYQLLELNTDTRNAIAGRLRNTPLQARSVYILDVANALEYAN